MKLRNQLVALSLLMLLLPWSAWTLLQELERYLRETQESALLDSARLVAGALPLEFQTELLFAPPVRLGLRDLEAAPVLDGFTDEWPDPEHPLVFRSPDGRQELGLLAGAEGGRLYLAADLRGAAGAAASPGGQGLTLVLRTPRGIARYHVRPEAPGPLYLRSDTGESGQAEGQWLETANGYRAELSLPLGAPDADLGVLLSEGESGPVCWIDPSAGLQAGGRDALAPATLACAGESPRGWPARGQWLSLSARPQRLSEWLGTLSGQAQRAWLTDDAAWVWGDSGADDRVLGGDPVPPDATTWLQRLLYRAVAESRPELREDWPPSPYRLADTAVVAALGGEESVSWSQEFDSARVRNTAAVPLVLDGEVRGAVVLQSSSEGLLLMTGQALGRLLLTTLALALGLAAALWFFASRLSRRVRRLSGAVSVAMERGVETDSLPLRDDRDELGELARNNEKLLRAVADYGHYLQTLAGKLSHELKTPLAITRSSLENLSSQPLDDDSRRFLDRAQEGVERQAAIVRAMSEASRLEAAIGAAEWETVDLGDLVSSSVSGYRAVWPGRRIELRLPDGEARLWCAPDLLVQALDKLVDNALSLSATGDEVRVILRREGGCWELAVQNTGSELPRDFQDRLFDSLVSVRERRGPEPHLGLGLYIVRLVVAAHRGEVSARNLPDGGGVEFLVRLPGTADNRG